MLLRGLVVGPQIVSREELDPSERPSKYLEGRNSQPYPHSPGRGEETGD